MINGRRLLRPHLDRFRAALAECRGDLYALDFKHQCAIEDLHRELEQTRADFEALKTVVRARHQAEAELDRLRAIRAATTTGRDLGMRLH